MDDDESLRAAFTSTANVLTNFYRHSQQAQRRSFATGTRAVSEEIAAWVSSNSRDGVVAVLELLSVLKRRFDELAIGDEESEATDGCSAGSDIPELSALTTQSCILSEAHEGVRRRGVTRFTGNPGVGDEEDVSLRVAFSGAANIFTQFYRHSQQVQRRASTRGKRAASEEIAAWVSTNSHNGMIVTADLLSALKWKVSELSHCDDVSEGRPADAVQPEIHPGRDSVDTAMAASGIRSATEPERLDASFSHAAGHEPLRKRGFDSMHFGVLQQDSNLYEQQPARLNRHVAAGLSMVDPIQPAACLNLHVANGLAMMNLSPCKIRRVQNTSPHSGHDSGH
jgi:hypothetical protein